MHLMESKVTMHFLNANGFIATRYILSLFRRQILLNVSSYIMSR